MRSHYWVVASSGQAGVVDNAPSQAIAYPV